MATLDIPTRSMVQSLPQLPEAFIDYMMNVDTNIDRPTKRRKLDDSSSGSTTENDAIQNVAVIKRMGWKTLYLGAALPQLKSKAKQESVRFAASRVANNRLPPSLIMLRSTSRDVLLSIPIPTDAEEHEDIYTALLVHQEVYKWDGSLRTECDVTLCSQDDVLVLDVSLTIKWTSTLSLSGICTKITKPSSLRKVLAMYFPDEMITSDDSWTPQDFYQAVHAPEVSGYSDELRVPGLESNLFRFQRRAVQWLLRREGKQWSPKGLTLYHPGSDPLPLSFRHAQDVDGKEFYISHLFGLVTFDVIPFKDLEQHKLQGGILCEEMGLGKTVEMISLISLHKQTLSTGAIVHDIWTGTDVRRTGATLIITPPSILKQWISEIEKHAPQLNVVHYKGVKLWKPKKKGADLSDLVDQLGSADIVITTYTVLSAEIYYTQLNGEKLLRTKSKYPRPRSPLMQLQWFRVCLDEAQMVESGVSKSAVVARMIPRVHAWCVTGTPVRKDVSDLQGLLIFLRHHPYDNIKHVWTSLITSHKHDFRQLFGTLALRHSKKDVRNELKLPAQRRYVITMPFTAIEEQHYHELFTQMCEECGVDSQGAPLEEDWDPDEVTEVMRSWLVRLRQTALHPEIGGKNRRALGQKEGPLRTVDQVLDVMMEQTDLALRTDQRNLLVSRLRRGQLFENSPRIQEALEIWTSALKDATEFVNESREQLEQEIMKEGARRFAEGSPQDSEEGESNEDHGEDPDTSTRLGTFRNRLRTALEMQHMAVFFQSNAYFQIKSDENMTAPNSEEFQSLEKLETEGYEGAKKLRQEILQEIYRKAERVMSRVAQSAANQSFTVIPEIPTSPPSGGLESRRILERLDSLAEALDAQANVLDEWRETTIEFLLRPLVDDDSEGAEITGEEYEQSHKAQDEVVVYVQALRAVIADRHDAVTGQKNTLIAEETKRLLRLARKGEDAYPEKTIETLTVRAQVKPPDDLGSLRGIVAELRTLVNTLRLEVENGSSRANNELTLVKKQFVRTQQYLSEQTKANAGLEREIDLFTTAMNARLEYYKQLQAISDMVSPHEGPNNDTVIAKMLAEEEKISKKIATAKSKRRYLEHLRLEANNPEEQRLCIICKEHFDVGSLTVCGHQFCKECMNMWWSSHRTCPVCKRKLLQADLHDITYKPQELVIHTEEVQDSSQQRASPNSKSKKTAIYTEISKTKLAEIKNIDLDGPSFTTKVDTLARHLIWLRDTDPGAKSIIFSQFKDFLDVLAAAFTRYRIGYSSIDRPNGIETFKDDPAIECFLLHARAHSSGLNLVNASHVFLCEPLLNTAIELQAIARVDRIGQHQETNVWLYLVDGTVEESIHEISVRRRMEHIGQNSTTATTKGKARENTPAEVLDSKLEEANSMELQDAKLAGLLAKGGKGGEMVAKEDLWDCLFGAKGTRARRIVEGSALLDDAFVARELRAGAAENRMIEQLQD